MRQLVVLLGLFAATLGGSLAHGQSTDAIKPKVKAPAAKPAPAARTAPLPPMPTAAPPAPVLPPPLAVPIRPMPPPLPAAVVADAAGEAIPAAEGLRITFGAGSSDLNPRTDAAIRGLVRATPPFSGTTFTIVAVAPGTEDDPSAPRRLSLSRALAVRSVLITEGVASPRIYVKALGASPQALSGGPPDRADVTLAGANPTTQPGQGRAP